MEEEMATEILIKFLQDPRKNSVKVFEAWLRYVLSEI